MRLRKCTILKHTSSQGSHYDWLMENPDSASFAQDELWTSRVMLPPEHWLEAGRLMLTPLPVHRRRYLTYQGPISGGRGRVVRIAQGHALLQHWSRTTCHLLLQWTPQNLPDMQIQLTLPPPSKDHASGPGYIVCHVEKATISTHR